MSSHFYFASFKIITQMPYVLSSHVTVMCKVSSCRTLLICAPQPKRHASSAGLVNTVIGNTCHCHHRGHQEVSSAHNS